MGKPVRAVRRFLGRKGKGKGKGKVKGGKAGAAGTFLAAISDEEADQIFLGKGKGKGTKGIKGSKGSQKGKRSSGKGKGRRLNPFGPDGERMKCDDCGADDHFRRDCTQGAVHGSAATGSSFYAVPPTLTADASTVTPRQDDGPLADMPPLR